MSENMNFAEEFPEAANNTPEQVATDAPMDTVVPAKAEKETYTLADGSQGSRAAFIREKFQQDNMSRKEIADTYGFAYRVVYSATVNMTNEAEAAGRGRSSVNAVIKVTANNQYVNEVDGKVYVDGELYEGAVEDLGELQNADRNEWIISKAQEGVSRGDIAKMLGMSYGVIYNITKDLEGTREKHEVTLEDGTVVSRSEYIRMLYAEGKSRGDIAKELDVPYTVVWQATKVVKSEQEKFADLVESLKGYADKVADPDTFAVILDDLSKVELVEETEEQPAEEAATEE